MAMRLLAGEYLGAPERALATGAFRALESSYGEGTELPCHAHERAHFCLVLVGTYTERIGTRESLRRPEAQVGEQTGVERILGFVLDALHEVVAEEPVDQVHQGVVRDR